MADKEKRSLWDELRYMLSLPEKTEKNAWGGYTYDDSNKTGESGNEPAAETDGRIAERAHDRLYKQNGAEGVFESVTDKFRPKTVPVETDEEAKNDGTIAGESNNVGDKKAVDLLEKLLGGPDPYGAKKSGLGMSQVPDANESAPEVENDPDEHSGAGVPDIEVNGYIEALRGILDPDYAARASEDVMGQYAAMTGGRPSSAAISAGTAARADAEAALLRELLAGGDTQSGESGGLLSGLLGGNSTTGETDVPEEYADYADLPSYDTIVPMLESFESEEDMGDYLADMVNKGIISEAVATEYLKRFDDPYEVYDSGGRIDYASMVKNPGGWTLIDDGGTNFFGGLNRNMRIKSPNGQVFTVAQLYRLLKKNGMDAKEAKDHLIKLQNYFESKSEEDKP